MQSRRTPVCDDAGGTILIPSATNPDLPKPNDSWETFWDWLRYVVDESWGATSEWLQSFPQPLTPPSETCLWVAERTGIVALLMSVFAAAYCRFGRPWRREAEPTRAFVYYVLHFVSRVGVDAEASTIRAQNRMHRKLALFDLIMASCCVAAVFADRDSLAVGLSSTGREKVIMVALGLIVLVLVTHWNAFCRDYCKELDSLRDHSKALGPPQRRVPDQEYTCLLAEYCAIQRLGRSVRLFYWFILGLFAVGLGSFLTTTGPDSAPTENPNLSSLCTGIAFIFLIGLFFSDLFIAQRAMTRLRRRIARLRECDWRRFPERSRHLRRLLRTITATTVLASRHVVGRLTSTAAQVYRSVRRNRPAGD